VDDIALAGTSGSVSFVLSGQVVDPATGTIVSPDPERQYPFQGVPGSSDPLVANDNALEPSGSYYTVVIAGASQTYKYSVLINHANGATQQLGNLIANQVQPSASMGQYLPLPGGTAEAGYVPVATGTGNQSQWSPGGSGGSGGYPATPVVSGTAATGDVLTATSATTATWQVPTGVGGGVSSVSAGDASIAVGGTASAPTVETGRLDQVASLHPPTAAVGMNGQKVTSLANGSASTDAVAFGQLGSAAFQATSAFDASGTAASAASAAQTAAEAASLPLPTGTATAGYVAVATGSGNATAWQAQSGGGGGGNIDGGSATTGMLPVGNIDGGNA
jgi:hypothetical protein